MSKIIRPLKRVEGKKIKVNTDADIFIRKKEKNSVATYMLIYTRHLKIKNCVI